MKPAAALLAAGAIGIGVAIASAAYAHGDVFSVYPSGHDGTVDGSPTSCAFADNVHAAYFDSGQSRTFVAYCLTVGVDPVTAYHLG